MWYAVETAFIDGKHFASRPCFNMNVDLNYKGCQKGICLARHEEAPHNTCETFMEGRIEIHVDWFQTKEQAMKFCDGTLTYIYHQNVKYRKDIKSHIRSFRNWEAVPVTEGMEPFRGIYENHEMN